ncbi:hypothetical protein DFQ30_004276, partial [Apophysomyces sp. BC1015]
NKVTKPGRSSSKQGSSASTTQQVFTSCLSHGSKTKLHNQVNCKKDRQILEEQLAGTRPNQPLSGSKGTKGVLCANDCGQIYMPGHSRVCPALSRKPASMNAVRVSNASTSVSSSGTPTGARQSKHHPQNQANREPLSPILDQSGRLDIEMPDIPQVNSYSVSGQPKDDPTLSPSVDNLIYDASTQCKLTVCMANVDKVNKVSENNFLSTDAPRYFHVPVTIESVRTWATIDSGATKSILAPSLVDKLDLKVRPTSGVIFLAAHDVSIPRTGYVEGICISHNGIAVSHDFEVFETNRDLEVIIGTDLMSKIGISLSGLAVSWTMSNRPRTTDPILAEKDVPNSSPFGTKEQQENFLTAIQPYLEENAKIPTQSVCTIPESIIHLETPRGKTAYRRQYPIPETLKPVLREQVQKWLEDGVIKRAPVNTSFNSPITFAPKKDLD